MDLGQEWTHLSASYLFAFSYCSCVHGILKTRMMKWFSIPFFSGPRFAKVSTITHLSWVALHSMAHCFIELHKAMIHVIILVSFLWFLFSFWRPWDSCSCFFWTFLLVCICYTSWPWRIFFQRPPVPPALSTLVTRTICSGVPPLCAAYVLLLCWGNYYGWSCRCDWSPGQVGARTCLLQKLLADYDQGWITSLVAAGPHEHNVGPLVGWVIFWSLVLWGWASLI